MSCITHHIGAPVRLKNRQVIKIQGRNQILVSGTEGIIRNINESNHTMLVQFRSFEKPVILPADDFHSPTESTDAEMEA